MKCPILILAAILTAMTSTSAWPADYSSQVTLKINRVFVKSVSFQSPGLPTVFATLTNQSAYRLTILIDCTFLADDIPATKARGYALNVTPGEPAYVEIGTMDYADFDSAACRVSSARPQK